MVLAAQLCQASSLLSLVLQVILSFVDNIHLWWRRLLNTFVGAGKTTLLNFLSGREISKNLKKTGQILVNGTEKDDLKNFSAFSAYVQ